MLRASRFPAEAAIAKSEPNDAPTKTGRKIFRAASLASIGLEMGIATGLGWWIGQRLDRHFGTEPWLMLVFLLLGIAAGFKGLWRVAREAKAAMRESKE